MEQNTYENVGKFTFTFTKKTSKAIFFITYTWAK
jgi:hypothetical protein